jgi:hypothetical protein
LYPVKLTRNTVRNNKRFYEDHAFVLLGGRRLAQLFRESVKKDPTCDLLSEQLVETGFGIKWDDVEF